MDQTVIDTAVAIATKSALNNHPVKRIVWIPPQKVADNPEGSFVIEYVDDLKTIDTLSWEG